MVVVGVLAHLARRRAWKAVRHSETVIIERHIREARIAHWIRVVALTVMIIIVKNFLGLTREYPPHAVYDYKTKTYYMGRKILFTAEAPSMVLLHIASIFWADRLCHGLPKHLPIGFHTPLRGT
ncbi:hypothetical protein HRbin02_01761 [Candidatus Calditenuaceae archaeon HR02]|nr:hypothetical protein HRbin02_01761 [Candidatus Calditenuaceae archaeon HR02]